MTIYVKKYGFNMFYKCNAATRKSNRGYLISNIQIVEKISKSKYYNIPSERRFILPIGSTGIELHEIGNSKTIQRIGELVD